MAAEPEVWAQSLICEALKVSEQVESQLKNLPSLNGYSVAPSGLLPFRASRPKGSRLDAIPADANDLLIISLRWLCLGKRPALLLHDSP